MRRSIFAVAGCVMIVCVCLVGCGGKTTQGAGSTLVWDQCATRTACWQAALKYNPTYDAGVVDGGALPADCPPSDKITYLAMKDLAFHGEMLTGKPVYHADSDTCCYASTSMNE